MNKNWFRIDDKKILLPIISVVFLTIGLWYVGVSNVTEDFSKFPTSVIFSVLLLFICNFLVVTYRLKFLLSSFDIVIPFNVVARANIQGQLASMFFISLFGQILGRQLVLKKYGISPVIITALTAIEKIILFLVGSTFGFLGMYYLVGLSDIYLFLENIALSHIVFIVSFSYIVSIFLGHSKLESDLFRRLFSSRSIFKVITITSITLGAQSLILCAFALSAKSISADIDWWPLIAAAAFTSFCASLPISVNGWGIREIAAVFSFGIVGIPYSSALAISILIGVISSLTILLFSPFYLKKKEIKILFPKKITTSINKSFSIERIGAWFITSCTTMLIFFQIQVPLENGIINVNFADAFSVLSLSAVGFIFFEKKTKPKWRINSFNYVLIGISLLMLFSFFNGLQHIGITQWALTNRLIGWLVILGYLSIGVLSVLYLGQHGLGRLIDILIITASCIIVFQAIYRGFFSVGWFEGSNISGNFEGFSNNRNAFSYQLIICSILIMSFSEKNKRISENLKRIIPSPSPLTRVRSYRYDIFIILHGVIIAGIILTGSRTGVITELLVFLCALTLGVLNVKTLAKSLIIGFFAWFTFVIVTPWIGSIILSIDNIMLYWDSLFEDGIFNSVQSGVSTSSSNIERWETITHGIELWKETPIFGTGLGVFIEQSTQWFSRPIVIHSTPIWILVEFGFIGIVSFFIMLAYCTISLLKLRKLNSYHYSILLLLFSFVVFGLPHEIFNQRLFWLVLGICLALPFNEVTGENKKFHKFTGINKKSNKTRED